MRQNIILSSFTLFLVALILDLIIYHGFKRVTGQKTKINTVLSYIYWSIPAIFFIGFLLIAIFNQSIQKSRSFDWVPTVFGIWVLIYMPKLIFMIFLLIEDLTYLVKETLKKSSFRKTTHPNAPATAPATAFVTATVTAPVTAPVTATVPQRKATSILKTGVIIGFLLFMGIGYGILIGRYDFQFKKVNIHFTNLPKSYEGFKIIQLSDIHIGSLKGKQKKVAEIFQKINEERPDLILITGDLVNYTAEEMDSWISLFQKLNAKYGKFSVLGNHDYADYVNWESKDLKEKNHEKLLQLEKLCGFKLLLNESVTIKLNNDSIALIGVENWGNPPFNQYGDYDRASKGVIKVPFKILLSHDPTHWDAKILKKTDVTLTFSGHTHGGQVGINTSFIRWTPVQYMYPRWAGLYKENNQYLYVNSGFGFIGFPARLGIPPEITVIELFNR